MHRSDRAAELVERNRALLTRAAELHSRTAETVTVSQHLVQTLRENAAERKSALVRRSQVDQR